MKKKTNKRCDLCTRRIFGIILVKGFVNHLSGQNLFRARIFSISVKMERKISDFHVIPFLFMFHLIRKQFLLLFESSFWTSKFYSQVHISENNNNSSNSKDIYTFRVNINAFEKKKSQLILPWILLWDPRWSQIFSGLLKFTKDFALNFTIIYLTITYNL